MYTLYNVTEGTKKLIKILVIFLVSIASVYILFNIGIFVKNIIAPTPPPQANAAFGKLPSIQFPPDAAVQNFSYTIDTKTGTLPTFPETRDHTGKLLCVNCITVHLLATPSAALDSFTIAQNIVSSVGFKQQAIPLSERRYQWIDPTPPSKKLIYDIISHNFTLTSNFLSDSDVLSGNGLKTEEDAKQTARDYLSSMQALHDDLDQEKIKTTLFRIVGGAMAPATSLSNTQIIRIDYFQNDIDGHSIYYPIPNQSIMSALVSSGQFNPQVVQAHWTYYPVSPEMSTYPIYTPSEAYELLKQGKAYIASYKGTDTTIAIANIQLGYYMNEQIDDNDPKYLMPIIVFEGNNDFVAYVSAVKNEWIGN